LEKMVEYFIRRNQSLMAMLKEIRDTGEDPQDVMDIAMEAMKIELLSGKRDN
jgi:hypothetical protein